MKNSKLSCATLNATEMQYPGIVWFIILLWSFLSCSPAKSHKLNCQKVALLWDYFLVARYKQKTENFCFLFSSFNIFRTAHARHVKFCKEWSILVHDRSTWFFFYFLWAACLLLVVSDRAIHYKHSMVWFSSQLSSDLYKFFFHIVAYGRF